MKEISYFVWSRTNVNRETYLNTLEKILQLSVRLGITDFALIVFSDKEDILEGSKDPD